MSEIGIPTVQTHPMQKYSGEISAEGAQDVIRLCIENLSNAGVILEDFQVKLELVDNPEVQCARIVE